MSPYDTSTFKTVAFIDANVALECLALEQLPWREIDRVGLILVLATATVVREVDRKKNTPRLNDHARRFNALLRPILSGDATVVLREQLPRVELALAEHRPIDWAAHPNLERDEPDDKIIAEVLHTPISESAAKLFVSQDIRPLHQARMCGLQVHPIGENWLRQKQLGEADKRAAALQREVDLLRSTQPQLHLAWRHFASEPVQVFRFDDLSDAGRAAVTSRILALNPKPSSPGAYDFVGLQDSTINERYKRYQSKIIPAFTRDFSKKVEGNYGQFKVELTFENLGNVTAEDLRVDLLVKGGTISTRWLLVSPDGPGAPQLRSGFDHNSLFGNQNFAPQPPREKTVVYDAIEAKRNCHAQIACADFRHGRSFTYTLYASIDPRSDAEFSITAEARARNLHGVVSESVVVAKHVISGSVWEQVDENTLKFRFEPEVVQVLRDECIPGNRIGDIVEFDCLGWDR